MYFSNFTSFRIWFDVVYIWCLYKQKCFDKKIELKIESWGKQNRDFDLEAILGKVAISMSTLEIVTPLLMYATYKPIITLPETQQMPVFHQLYTSTS